MTAPADNQGRKDERKYLFDDPGNVKRLLVIFFSSVAVLMLLDLVVHKHAHFAWEEWFGFYPVFGFVACVLLVIIAKYVLRPLVMRKENYYD
jgi:hypothetical protein